MTNTNTNTENAIASENCDEKAIALASFLGIEPDEVSKERHECYGMGVYSADGGEYAVGTDVEADYAWNEALDSYISDSGLLDSIPSKLRCYFDIEAWKRDARYDGRGHSLASYDDEEMELDGGFFAFRIN